jgi:hypothetical protein
MMPPSGFIGHLAATVASAGFGRGRRLRGVSDLPRRTQVTERTAMRHTAAKLRCRRHTRHAGAALALIALLAACGGGEHPSASGDEDRIAALEARLDEAEERAAAAEAARAEPTPEPTSDPETTPEPTPEPEPEPDVYGSDSVLDDLHDRCEDGDTEACDQLFWYSPLGSEYEAFAAERGSSDMFGSVDKDMDDDAIARIVLELTWDNMSPDQRSEICDGLAIGLPVARIIADSAGPTVTTEMISSYLSDMC